MKKILLFLVMLLLVSSIAYAGAVSFYLYDNPARSVELLVDTSGTVVNRHTYNAFGNINSSQENISNNFKYAGEQFDKETGLVFLRKRYYDPTIGRFITKDPHLGIKVIPQTKNPYPYCNNNPATFTDPSGDFVLETLVALLGGTISWELEAMNPKSTPASQAAAAIIGGVGGVITTYLPHPAVIGGIAALRNIVTTKLRGEEPSILGATQSGLFAIAGGYLGQGIGALSGSDVLGKLMGANSALWLGAAFSDFSSNAAEPQKEEYIDSSRRSFRGPDWPNGGGGGGSLGGGSSNFGSSNGLMNLGSNIYATPAFMAANYGGVSLSKTAELLTDLTEVKGAFYDDKTGQIILVGKQNLSLPQMKLDDLAVAVNSVYSGVDPGVSIDMPIVNGQMPVRYEGQTSQTEFGYTMFESDRVMKTLGLGKDNISGSPVSSSVTGYKNILDRYRETQTFPEGETSHRFWFKPKEMKLVKSSDGSSMVFDQATMELLTESKFQNNVYGDPQSEAFAANLTEHYDDYANQFSILKDLKRLGKVVSVVKWLKDNDIPIDLEFIKNYQVPQYSTPTNTPATTAYTEWQNGSTTYTLTITGGVTYTKPNEYLSDGSNVTDPLKQSAISQRPSETDFKWNFTSPQSEALTAVAESFSRSRKDGNLKFSSADLSYPADCDFSLEFIRYYDSFYDKTSGFGFGWEFRPFQIRFPLRKQNFTFGTSNLILSLYPELSMINRGAGQEEAYNLLGIDSSNLPLYAKEGSADILREMPDGTLVLSRAQDIKLTFDSTGNLLTTTDKNNKSISYSYQNGKLTSITAPTAGAINIAYSSDKITSVSGPGGRTISYGYDGSNNLTSVTNAESQTIQYEYDSDRRINRIVDARGNQVFQGAYDDYNRLTSQTINQDLDFGRSFTLAQRKTVETDPNSNEVTKLYDDKYRVTEQIDQQGNRVNLAYDGDNGPQSITDAKGATTQYTYDVKGNVTCITQPDSTQVKLYYDAKNNLVAVRDANAKDTAYGYDNNNRLAEIYHSAVLNFDGSGNLTGWQYDTGNITAFAYDASGRLTSVTDPQSRKQIFENYNSFGLPQQIKSTSGFALTNTFDNLARLKSINDPAGNNISFEYTNADQIKSITTAAGTSLFHYDANNNLASIEDAKTYPTAFNYDAKNNLESVLDAENGATSYGYDKFNNLNSVTLPNNTQLGYEFDELNRLVLSQSGKGTPVPVIAVLQENLDLGSAGIGGSTSKALTVYNIGNKELMINNVSIDNGVFSVDTNAAIIPKGGEFTFNLSFSPQTEGEASAILSINSDDPQAPLVSVNLIAHGTLPSLSASASSVFNGIRVTWQPYNNSSARFDHYAVYRSTSPISDISALTPLTTISNIATTVYTDDTATIGQSYYYTTVALDAAGNKLTQIESFGPFAFLNLGNIGSTVAVVNSARHETKPSLAYNSAQKEYLMVYEYDSGTSNGYDIYGQRISEEGIKVGEPFAIIDTGYREGKPQVAYNSINNEYMVVCETDLSGTGTHYHVTGQRLSAAGAKINSWFYVYETPTQENKPRLAYNATDNKYYVVMEYNKNGDGLRWDILGCILASDGTRISTNIISNSDSNIQLHNPTVVYNFISNQVLVAYENTYLAQNYNLIWGYRFDNSNQLIGEAIIIANWIYRSYYPRLAYNPDRNEYMCVFQYNYNGDGVSFGVGVRRILADGTSDVCPIYTMTGENLTNPDIAYFQGRNEYLFSCTDNFNATTEYNILGQRIRDTDAQPVTTETIHIAFSEKPENNNAIIYNPDKQQFLVGYDYDANADGSNFDIKAQRVGILTLDLSVDPISLDFGSSETMKLIKVTNTGGMPMYLHFTRDQPWIIAPHYVITPSPEANINIEVSRQNLAPGNYSGNVSIDQSGTILNIPVTMTVLSQPPLTPYNPSPSNGATGQADIGSPLTVTMSWLDSDPDVGDSLTYDLYFSGNYALVNNQDSACLVSSAQSTSSYKSAPLQHNQAYYWRVAAKDASNSTTAGPVWSFTTLNISAPQLIAYSPDPTPNKRPTLSWNAVSSASKYHLQISADANFAAYIVNDANVSALTYALTQDLPQGKIYWRVSCIDGLGNESSFSAADDFTIKTQAPQIPALIPYSPNPTNNQKPTLSWEAVSDAAFYRCQISPASDFSTLIADKYLTSTSYTPENNLPDGEIYWRISSKDMAGNESAFCASGSFKIDVTAPAQISGLTAAANATQITLNWNSFNNSAGDFKHFNIYRSNSAIANVSGMTPMSEAIIDSAVTTFIDSSVTEGTAYYYAVTAEDTLGNENKSVTAFGPVVITPPNNPPELSPIGNKTVSEGELLEFSLSATDPDNQQLAYSVSGLPQGAYFNANTGIFSWLPNYNQQGSYALHFEVSDGELSDSEDITITVNNSTLSPAAGQSIGIKLKVRVVP